MIKQSTKILLRLLGHPDLTGDVSEEIKRALRQINIEETTKEKQNENT